MIAHARKTRMGILAVAAALAASASACKSRPGAGSSAGSIAAPAPWEPFDDDFKGCEGG
jgi:hypothetical protein